MMSEKFGSDIYGQRLLGVQDNLVFINSLHRISHHNVTSLIIHVGYGLVQPKLSGEKRPQHWRGRGENIRKLLEPIEVI